MTVTRQSPRLPRTAAMLAICAAVLTLVVLGAAGRASPATARAAAMADGTISGTVRGFNGPAAVDGRIVEVVNLTTGERQRTVTDRAGGFKMRVKPGKYRAELILRAGERLTSGPGTLDVSPSDLDVHAELVVGSVRLSRPRSPAYRTADGLGSPIA